MACRGRVATEKESEEPVDELLTVKLRLVVASVDKAKEMGIDWWETDPALSSRARQNELAP